MWPNGDPPPLLAVLIAELSLVDSDLIGGSGFLRLSRAGSDMFLTLSRIIWRIVFRNALRNSDVLQQINNLLFYFLVLVCWKTKLYCIIVVKYYVFFMVRDYSLKSVILVSDFV